MTTPFTYDPKQRNTNLASAREQVVEALVDLGYAKQFAENWADFETIGYFEHSLSEWLSSDQGEAGFASFVRS
jgi:Holliday junction resolvasome RuvABC DNA-binding subunit